MQSRPVTVFIYGILFVVTITSAYELIKPKNRGRVRTANVVTIRQLTKHIGHPEGPHWDEKSERLYFVDIPGQKIYHLNPVTGDLSSIYIADGQVGLAIPVEDSSDQLVAAVGTDIVLITWDAESGSTDFTIKIFATVDKDRYGRTRLNDGKADSHGQLWAGTMAFEDDAGSIAPDLGSLYLINSRNFSVERKISPLSISNGLAWNRKDNLFYHIDSPTRQIAAYDYDAENEEISNRRIIFDLKSTNFSGIPDGMTIDTRGNLWIALFDGQHVINVDPVRQELLRAIQMPATKVTSVAFGGPSYDILYVTTSTYELDPSLRKSQPGAGSVFAIEGLGVKGFAANKFSRRGL